MSASFEQVHIVALARLLAARPTQQCLVLAAAARADELWEGDTVSAR